MLLNASDSIDVRTIPAPPSFDGSLASRESRDSTLTLHSVSLQRILAKGRSYGNSHFYSIEYLYTYIYRLQYCT